ncbi:MAG: OsmC family protein [Vicinamibacteria bacterium]
MEEARAEIRLGPEDYKTTMKVRGHVFTADEPQDKGGLDTAPTPTEMLTAALGACTAITLRMYAKRKGWELGEVRVEVEYAQDGESRKAERRISFSGDLSEEQRARLLQIANACPVHKALTKGVEVASSLG